MTRTAPRSSGASSSWGDPAEYVDDPTQPAVRHGGLHGTALRPVTGDDRAQARPGAGELGGDVEELTPALLLDEPPHEDQSRHRVDGLPGRARHRSRWTPLPTTDADRPLSRATKPDTSSETLTTVVARRSAQRPAVWSTSRAGVVDRGGPGVDKARPVLGEQDREPQPPPGPDPEPGHREEPGVDAEPGRLRQHLPGDPAPVPWVWGGENARHIEPSAQRVDGDPVVIPHPGSSPRQTTVADIPSASRPCATDWTCTLDTAAARR